MCIGATRPNPNDPPSSGTTWPLGAPHRLSCFIACTPHYTLHAHPHAHHTEPHHRPTTTSMLRFARRSGGQHAGLVTSSLPATAHASPAVACGSPFVQTTWGRRHFASAASPTKVTKSKLPYRPIHKLLVANRGTARLPIPFNPTTFPRRQVVALSKRTKENEQRRQ
jgi:hypothetical protein